MDPLDFKVLENQKHWWFTSKAKLLAMHIQKGKKVLEVGCGISDLHSLIKIKELVGLDLNKEAVKINKRKNMNCIQGDARKLPFKTGSFDVVVLSDVLEHIQEDRTVLMEARRVVRKGGRILITVPAHPHLWSQHDRDLGHVRRYTRKNLLKLIASCNLKTKKISYWNSSLYLPILLALKLGKGTKAIKKTNPALNTFFSALLTTEAGFIKKGINIPWGVTLFAEAEK